MDKGLIFVVDFDDTLTYTSKHLCDSYNHIVDDHLNPKDFLDTSHWRLVPKFSALMDEIVEAILHDPSRIPIIEGATEFFEYILSISREVIILTKRHTKNSVIDYIRNVIKPANLEKNIDKLSVVFVKEWHEKGKFVNTLNFNKNKVFVFEDRIDSLKTFPEEVEALYIAARPWNDPNIFKYNGNLKRYWYNTLFDAINDLQRIIGYG